MFDTFCSFCSHIKSTSLSYAGNPVTAEEGRRKSLSEATYKLRKAKSMVSPAPFVTSTVSSDCDLTSESKSGY